MAEKLTFALIFALGIIAVSASPIETFEKASFEHLIVGGEEAIPYEFPYTVDVNRGFHYCGGSIIAPTWIITAAHCSQASPSNYVIIAGDHNIKVVEGPEQRRKVIRIFIHPDYNSGTISHDVALMELESPLEFNKYVQPVQLPPREYEPPTINSTVVGWGALTEGGRSPDELYKVTVPLVDNTQCNKFYSGTGYKIDESMICAGTKGKDSCQGDSGGPMICDSPAGFVHCGIVSWGLGCARDKYPGVYGRTSHFLDFIEQITGLKVAA